MDAKAYGIEDLLAIMARLRAPDGGCPWDRAQDFTTIAPYTVEEAYEVSDAIARDAMDELRDELGDLLFQTVFHARLAEERGAFDFSDVVEAICDKMIRRHPHVFGESSIADADAQTEAWEAMKADERARAARREGREPSLMDGVARGLPAHLRAVKLQKRAARAGFDWDSVEGPIDKAREELSEVSAALAAGESRERITEEIGDLLFSVVNIARFLAIDPEHALAEANRKFERRFRHIEKRLAKAGIAPGDATLAEMETHWQEAKRKEAEEGEERIMPPA
ncbi:MAG: nucleoside triphosphate pyrophosphohydrolase [Rhodothalassiaceae bacterium]